MKKVLLLGTLLALASLAGADTLVDTMPGDNYDTGYGATIMQNYSGYDWSQGNAFTVSGNDYYLDRVSAALSWVDGVNKIDLQIWDDNGGLPGSILESWTFTNQMGSFGNNNPPLVGVSTLSPVLYAGETYYVIAYAPTGPQWSAFNMNDFGYRLPRAVSQDDQASWSVSDGDAAAFRVEGTIVPEPGLISLGGLLLGAGALWLRRK